MTSPSLGFLVVFETENPNLSGYSANNLFSKVDLPVPDGPEMTIGLVEDVEEDILTCGCQRQKVMRLLDEALTKDNTAVACRFRNGNNIFQKQNQREEVEKKKNLFHVGFHFCDAIVFLESWIYIL